MDKDSEATKPFRSATGYGLATITHNMEPSILIPLSLVMDLYAMAIIADNKQVIEGLKKAIKGEK